MSQYLSLVLALVAFARQNAAEATRIWQLAVAAWEASQKLIEAANESLGQVMPRDAGAALTPDEEDAERQFSEQFGAPRGPFGNGKVLRWLLTTNEGKAILAALMTKIPGIGS